MPKSGPDGGMDLLAQAMRKVYGETVGADGKPSRDEAVASQSKKDAKDDQRHEGR